MQNFYYDYYSGSHEDFWHEMDAFWNETIERITNDYEEEGKQIANSLGCHWMLLSSIL